jgi:hypothetical protein
VIAFLTWIESSALGDFMRESSAWTYAIVNLTHILGIATLFGSILVLDLALVGVLRHASLATLAGAIPPVAGSGLALAAVSGLGLLASNATEYEGNPFFLIKFPLIALGILNAVVVTRSRSWRAVGFRELTSAEQHHLAWLGGTSLVCWSGAITAGRMIGYW